MGFFDGLVNAIASAGTAVANTMAPGNPLVQGLTAGANGFLNQLGVDKANKQNQALLDKQMDFQREMFNKQLEANRHSIIDQYRQYKELGINPLSMSMSQANMVSPSGAPSASPAVFMSPMERAQVNLLNAETAKTRKEADAIDPAEAPSRTKANLAAAAHDNAQTTTEDALRPYMQKLSQSQYDKCVADANVAYMQVYQLDELVTQLQNQNKYFELDKFFDFLLKEGELKKLDVEQRSLLASIAIGWKDYYDRHREVNSRIALNNANTGLVQQQTETERENTRLRGYEADVAGYEAYVKSMANQLDVPYEMLQRDLSQYRFESASFDNKTPRIVFDTERYNNTSKGVKEYLWFMNGVGYFGGLAGKYLKQLIMQ